jgi:hypothetical protein
MNLYLKITIGTFTIWILASFINALFYATWLSVIINYQSGLVVHTLIAFFVSLLFSAPGFFVFWIILLVKLSRGIYERALFRAALSTGFILATATALTCLELPARAFATGKYLFILFAIISATSSIMIHFNHFKKINKQA